jgi:hypothetical protein
MAAEIVQFPKRIKKPNVVKSLDLQHCWDSRLQNPYLNSLYKSELSYAERWYLHAVHCLNFDKEDHPLMSVLLNPSDYMLNLLYTCVNNDLKIQLKALESIHLPNPYAMTADYNIRRLNKWKTKWECLINYRDRL